jgi:hypothetical protein
MDPRLSEILQFAPDFQQGLDVRRGNTTIGYYDDSAEQPQWVLGRATVDDATRDVARQWLLTPGNRKHLDFYYRDLGGADAALLPAFELSANSLNADRQHFNSEELHDIVKVISSGMQKVCNQLAKNKSSMLCVVTVANRRCSYRLYYPLLRITAKHLKTVTYYIEDFYDDFQRIKRTYGVGINVIDYHAQPLNRDSYTYHMPLPLSFNYDPSDLTQSLSLYQYASMHRSTGALLSDKDLAMYAPWKRYGIADPHLIMLQILDLNAPLHRLYAEAHVHIPQPPFKATFFTHLNKYKQPNAAHSMLLDHDMPATPDIPQHTPRSDLFIDMRDPNVYFDPVEFDDRVRTLIIDGKGLSNNSRLTEYINQRFVWIVPDRMGHKVRSPYWVRTLDLDARPQLCYRLQLEINSLTHWTRGPFFYEEKFIKRDGSEGINRTQYFRHWTESQKSARVSGVCYLPEGPDSPSISSKVDTAINLWQGFVGYQYDMSKIDRYELLNDHTQPLSVILNYVHRALCNNKVRHSLMLWSEFRQMFVYPHQPTERMPIIIGPQGTGKSLLISLMHQAVFGIQHARCEVDTSRFANQFNSLFYCNSVFMIDEAKFSKLVWTLMKGLITGTVKTIELKHVDVGVQDTTANNFLCATNVENDSITLETRERRLHIIQCNPTINYTDFQNEVKPFLEAVKDPRAGPQIVYFLRHLLTDEYFNEQRGQFFIGELYNSIRFKSFNATQKWFHERLLSGTNICDDKKGDLKEFFAEVQLKTKSAWVFFVPQSALFASIRAQYQNRQIEQNSIMEDLSKYGCHFIGDLLTAMCPDPDYRDMTLLDYMRDVYHVGMEDEPATIQTKNGDIPNPRAGELKVNKIAWISYKDGMRGKAFVFFPPYDIAKQRFYNAVEINPDVDDNVEFVHREFVPERMTWRHAYLGIDEVSDEELRMGAERPGRSIDDVPEPRPSAFQHHNDNDDNESVDLSAPDNNDNESVDLSAPVPDDDDDDSSLVSRAKRARVEPPARKVFRPRRELPERRQLTHINHPNNLRDDLPEPEAMDEDEQ